MIIKEANKAKIEKMIKEAEGKATARTITYHDIVDDIDSIEKRLHITKSKMVGIRANVDRNAEKFPRAYKYTPYSTQYTIIRKTSGWDLTCVERAITRYPTQRFKLCLTDEAKEAVIKANETFE